MSKFSTSYTIYLLGSHLVIVSHNFSTDCSGLSCSLNLIHFLFLWTVTHSLTGKGNAEELVMGWYKCKRNTGSPRARTKETTRLFWKYSFFIIWHDFVLKIQLLHYLACFYQVLSVFVVGKNTHFIFPIAFPPSILLPTSIITWKSSEKLCIRVDTLLFKKKKDPSHGMCVSHSEDFRIKNEICT